ncbi:MAG: NTP transferase domain-containing protein, partial [Lachnospiraceae bacterium]|nr:NTP transferase domain-containing protein [Lachnospiraceae bacterium]
MKKTGAVISAAGHNSSVSSFQPLMMMGGTTVIRRIIIMLRQAGVDPIVVITGRDGDEVEKHISKMRVICLRNEEYEITQMYDSIQMGLNYIEDLCDRALILPVKFPMFLEDTVKQILKSESPIACPVYEGRRGHPILISKSMFPKLRQQEADGGLRSILRLDAINPYVEEIPVSDQGIILSVESDEDCRKRYDHSRKIPVHSVTQLYLEGDEIFFGPGIAQFLTLVDYT